MESIYKVEEPSLSYQAWQNFEKLNVYLGLRTIPARFGFYTVSAIGLISLTKPSFAYDEKGQMRPFMLLSPKDPSATLLPVWLVGILSGLIGVSFI